MKTSRRRALQGLGLLALGQGSVAVPAAPDAAANKIDGTADRATILRDFIRMRTSPDGAPVLWVYSGVLVVKPSGHVAQPVARIEGLSVTRAERRPDGRWHWWLDEAGYYCDLQTGRPAAKLVNPFTGAEVQPKHYRSPQQLLFGAADIQPGKPLPPGVQFRGEITQLAAVAGIVALTEDLYVRMSGPPARQAASLATFSTEARQLQRAPSRWVDCQFHYTTLNGLVSWLGMDDPAGVQDMRLVGVKCRMDDARAVPAWLRQRVKADHADLELTDR